MKEEKASECSVAGLHRLRPNNREESRNWPSSCGNLILQQKKQTMLSFVFFLEANIETNVIV